MPLYPNFSEVNIRMHPSRKHWSSTLVEPSAAPGVTAETLSLHPRKWDGAIQGKHHHEETLKHKGPWLGLKELTFHTENEGESLAVSTS